MPGRRKSSITALPVELRDTLDRLIREGRYTIDEITEHINQLGAEVSRSAVGRHHLKVTSQMENFAKAREMATAWVEKFGDAPQGDVGQLLIQMLQTIAFQNLGDMTGDEGGKVGPMDLMLLSKALQSMVSAEKTSLERQLKIREETRKQVMAEVEKRVNDGAKAAGMGPEQAAFWRQQVLGVTG